MTSNYPNLKELREKLIGYKLASVARLSGLSLERVIALECDTSEPTIYELEKLAALYGIDAETLSERPIQVADSDAIQVLPSLPEFQDLTDTVRARVVAAATAARDLRTLQALNDMQRPTLEPLLPGLVPPSAKASHAPYRQGALLANKVRELLSVGQTAAISSMRDFVRGYFPRLALLWADLTSEGPAGLTFADLLRGPTVVLNIRGKNTNPAVRRFSLAHELCHLLVDWRRRDPLAVVSGYFSEEDLEREQRANAFAVRLICPQAVLAHLTVDQPDEAVRILSKYGLHYNAVRLYLRNEKGMEVPRLPPASLEYSGTNPELERAEAPEGVDGFPLGEVPVERQTEVSRLASRAYSLGKITRDAFADYLGVTPAAELEAVLDRFGFDPPAKAA